MKPLLGSAVFVASMFLMRKILIEAGLLTPPLALAFLACLVGIPLGGIVFLEGAMDQQSRDLRQEIEELRSQVEQLRRAIASPPS